ncbi:S41 family peptidase [Waterburya agarophytonicola K14]|uniref:Carboxyl-terminal-processing protease n=1 Tax=Waterburya agarophytonicola KI4 TaxID=2874699 RepID=A0A964BND7_9CYAN|nr:carboxyl-terminal processing protease CtpC [Waterburya agarophytonicola]MCC0176274.1 S41 family peptidase [Waterburya agarophytonicola KI4]
MVTKKKGLLLGTTAVALSTVAVTGAGIHLSQSQALIQSGPKETVDEVWQIINHQYVDTSFNHNDWLKIRQEFVKDASYENQEDAYKAIRDMLGKLEDPYTRFMNPEEFQNMRIDTSGELTGVGIQIAKDEETDRLIVISPIEDTPASSVGILAQDLIVKIDGTDTTGMDVNDAVKLIRGERGSKVTLTIDRNGKESDYEIVREKIEIHPVRAQVRDTELGKIGYIRLTTFNEYAARDMQNAIEAQEKEGVVAYVMDLRSNPGGLLYSSINIARMWLDEGTIVSTVDRKGISDKESAKNKALTDKPLVVLVNEGSASASEILSGALKDNKRATLLGTKTFGKGLVQSVRPLGDGSGLAVTIAKYLTPNGTDINKEGIPPDILVELDEEQLKELYGGDRSKLGTEADPQFAKALEILTEEVRAYQNSEPQAAK